MVKYTHHKDIINDHRRLIIDEYLVTRVAHVPLSEINRFINDVLEQEKENESLKDYTIEAIKFGKKIVKSFKDSQSTLVELDKIMEFGECNDPSLTIAVRQAKVLKRFFINGEWHEPRARDAIVVKPMRK